MSTSLVSSDPYISMHSITQNTSVPIREDDLLDIHEQLSCKTPGHNSIFTTD